VHLFDLYTSLQTEIDALTRTGVNKIVLLTHVGYPEEQELARKLHNVDVIVGGHSHTLLGATTAPGFPEPKGPYPTVIDNPDGGKTLVVQAWEGGRVLGRIQVTFDGKGHMLVLTRGTQAFFEFEETGRGSFQFGYIRGLMDCRTTSRGGEPAVEFSWEGGDGADGTPSTGRGRAMLRGDELSGLFCIHEGDESEFVATRATPHD